MDHKRVYETVKAHLLQQGCKSHVPSLGCRYRTEEGLMCAIGVLVEDYDRSMEGLHCNTLRIYGRLYQWAQPTNIAEELLLSRLQVVHDSYPVEDWGRGVDKVYSRLFNTDGKTS